MDLDSAFLSSILSEGTEAVKAAISFGVDEQALQGLSKAAFAFTVDYMKEYGEAPTPEMVTGKTGLSLPKPEGAADFFVREVLNRRLHQALHSKVTKVVEKIEERDPTGAFDLYLRGARDLRSLEVGSRKTVELFSEVDKAIEYYEKIKAGVRGVQTPWPSINAATLGFWPEELILFVARLGVGKSWVLSMLATHAWATGKKVLFVTTEMSRDVILRRILAYRLGLPYGDFRKGQLDTALETKLRDAAEELRPATGLRIVGGEFDFTIDALEAAVDETDPDILILDGAYLLKVGGEGRTERAANSFDELKRLSKRRRIPTVASTQFNRQAKASKTSSLTAEKIAMTDVAGWNADLIFGLLQTEDMKADGRLIFKPLKFREGVGADIECYWDFDRMVFSEIGESPLPKSKKKSKAIKQEPENSTEDLFGSGLEDHPF